MLRNIIMVFALVTMASPTFAGDPPAASDLSERVVHVAPDWMSSDLCSSPPIVASPEPGPGVPSVPNYICTSFDNGCPTGTATINGDGNLKGCSASCVGSCTRCSGAVTAATICVKKAGQTCYGSVNTYTCGSKGTGTCFTALPGCGDNNGCGCTTPAAYTGGTCSLAHCV